MNCRYLSGENIAPKNAAEGKRLIGKTVKYLRKQDIDKSGRGYFFPQTGNISDCCRRQIIFDGWDSVYISDLVEVVETKD